MCSATIVQIAAWSSACDYGLGETQVDMEPFSTAAIFAAINSAFRFAEYAVRIAEVGTENEVFVRTIQVVRNDLSETERLLSVGSVQSKLISLPGKLYWIKCAIHSTKAALDEIGRWVERARGEQQSTGSVRFETRVRWVLKDHERLVNRQAELSACHQQLSNVLSYLIPLEKAEPPSCEPPTYSDTMLFEDIISPRQKRRAISKEGGVHTTQAMQTLGPDSRAHDSPATAQLPPAYSKSADFCGTRTSTPPIQENSMEIREYSHIEAIPELYGESLSLSATNYQGPVDPFELFAGPTVQQSKTPLESNSVAISTVTTTVEDVLRASELPVNDPGPALGYPRAVAHGIIPISSKNILKRRPVPNAHGYKRPPTADQKITTAPSLTDSTMPACQESAAGTNDVQDALPPTSPRPSAPLAGHGSPPVPSNQSSVIFSAHQTPDTDQRFVSPLTCPPMSTTQAMEVTLARLETATSTRMRSQRALMDLLGSIDQP